jgi:hypothetical protein
VLLAYDPKDATTHQVFNQEGRRERCAAYTSKAVELAARIILADSKHSSASMSGQNRE